MSEEDPLLVIYGVSSSQPARAVYWLCLIKKMPFTLTHLQINQFGSEELFAVNPRKQVPVIMDGDFVLYEMPAILMYLCEKNQWLDYYPENFEVRALVNQYLHRHHNLTRSATTELMGPHTAAAIVEQLEGIGFGELVQKVLDPNKLELGGKVVTDIVNTLEHAYFMGDSTFLCSDQGTIADIACYEEIGQLQWAKLYDFSLFPKVQRWLDAMLKLPFHDDVHRYNKILGDINSNPNALERWLQAEAAGVTALEELGVKVGSL